MHAGLALYDIVSFGHGLPASGQLNRQEETALPRLRHDSLRGVLYYHDCQTDDARLTLSVLLDACARGADILNGRTITSLAPRDAIEVDHAMTAEDFLFRRTKLHLLLDEDGITPCGIGLPPRLDPSLYDVTVRRLHKEE